MSQPDQEVPQSVEGPGLIAVHEGDRIVPAPGSEAAVSARSGAEVHYYFPIHVVLTGDIGPEARQAIEEGIWEQLYQAFR
ncbi:hypothetical protein ACIGZJ_14895 [Kitasatospora sp. NPDC052868]|uniref:hypothetical protein n=1 Tax=Kitasatospora sp. NPDC052868 TaxID=3364060 RepID=UPI0037C99D55